MTEIVEDQTIWFPGIYNGREGVYAKSVGSMAMDEVIALVQKRAEEDGEWAIQNGFVGPNNENEPTMRKMMAWVSDETNIRQCVHANPTETLDWICRDLANGSKWVGGSRD
jgi:hypothetical protein